MVVPRMLMFAEPPPSRPAGSGLLDPLQDLRELVERLVLAVPDLVMVVWAHRWAVAGVLGAALAVRLALWVARFARWPGTIAAGRWVQIIPPQLLEPELEEKVWRTLEGLARFAQGQRWRLVRPPLSFEMIGYPDGRVEAGLWIPAWVPVEVAAAELAPRWPGAVITAGEHPRLPPSRRAANRDSVSVAGRRLVATVEQWRWLVDNPRSTTSGKPGASDPTLSAVFYALASRAGTTAVQVLFRPARRLDLAWLRRAAKRPDPGPRWQGPGSRLVLGCLLAVARLGIWLFDFMLPGGERRTTRTSPSPTGPDRDQRASTEEARAKADTGPHLLVSIRVFAVRDTQREANNAAQQAARGFTTASRNLGSAPLRWPAWALTRRWAWPREWLLVTTAEGGRWCTCPSTRPSTGSPPPPATGGHRHRPPDPERANPAHQPDMINEGRATVTTPADNHPATPPATGPRRWPARLRLAARDDPGRDEPKTLGTSPHRGVPEPVGLYAADARHHLHVIGPTGVGKSTLLVNLVLDDVHAGRGVAVFDPKGDLVRDLLDRLPREAGDRLVLIDPDERQAPAALNLFELGTSPQEVADQVVGVMGKVFAQHWGPRIDDLARHTVLTLARWPGATLGEMPILLQDHAFRRRVLAHVRTHSDPLEVRDLIGFWDWYDGLTPAAWSAQTGSLLSKLRAVLTRSFANDLFGVTASTFRLREILDGGILLVRLPPTLGADTVRLVGSLLLAALLNTAAARAD